MLHAHEVVFADRVEDGAAAALLDDLDNEVGAWSMCRRPTTFAQHLREALPGQASHSHAASTTLAESPPPRSVSIDFDTSARVFCRLPSSRSRSSNCSCPPLALIVGVRAQRTIHWPMCDCSAAFRASLASGFNQ
jgi:hypothetical protein